MAYVDGDQYGPSRSGFLHRLLVEVQVEVVRAKKCFSFLLTGFTDSSSPDVDPREGRMVTAATAPWPDPTAAPLEVTVVLLLVTVSVETFVRSLRKWTPEPWHGHL